MRITFGLTIERSAHGLLSRRDFNRLLRAEWEEVGHRWGREYRPKHFTPAGAREYGYAPRKGEQGGLGGKAFWRSYTGRKQKQKGHRNPLMWSGDSEEASRRYRLKATSRGVRIAMPTPKLNYRRAGSSIRMADELRTVSRGELAALSEYMAARIARRLRTLSTKQTKQIG